MRLIKAIVLLSILSLNLFGFYISFFVSRSCIKNEVAKSMTSIRSSSLEQFEFSVAEFNGLSRPDGDDDEVVINGAMYDVKSTEFKADKIIVYAKKDIAETNLISKFLATFGNESGADNGAAELLLKLLQQDFIIDNFTFHVADVRVLTSYQLVSVILISHVGDQLTPPPDSFLA